MTEEKKMWLSGFVLITVLTGGKSTDTDVIVEAAFQGHCGHTSPCEQLCYEIHDGMYECDCIEGYELIENGYSCQVTNTTMAPNNQRKSAEDVFYQTGTSFSAKLASKIHENKEIFYLDEKYKRNGNFFSGSKNNFEKKMMKTMTTKKSKNSDLFFNDQLLKYIVPESLLVNLLLKNSSQIVKNVTEDTKLSNNQSTAFKHSPTSFMKSNSTVADNTKANIYFKEESFDSVINPVFPTKTDNKEKSHPSRTEFEAYHNLSLQYLRDGKDISQHSNKHRRKHDCGSGATRNYGDQGLRSFLCPPSQNGSFRKQDGSVKIPRFSKNSWLAFPALQGAYKHVQIRVEFLPESSEGVIVLTGERDDLTGDFMALLLNKGFVEFWFDCGSGVGSVRSKEPIILNQWNAVDIYRHRWDAWLLLNQGKKVQGRSKGLFSRITFQEPVFLGGVGNITGLAQRIPIINGFIGCVKRFVTNEHEYKFIDYPLGDVVEKFHAQVCKINECFENPCQNGGKCIVSGKEAKCLCSISFTGNFCESRLEFHVPFFNGSSYLRYAPIQNRALIWLELHVILKPSTKNGIVLFTGHPNHGDFIAVTLNNGFVEFHFDLGSGTSIVRNGIQISIDHWHEIKISRTARLATLKVDNMSELTTVSSNGFWHLSLPYSLYLGGLRRFDDLPLSLKNQSFFVGCIQKVKINRYSLSLLSEALEGKNVDNCPHICITRPCGPLAECVPIMENYECRCTFFIANCSKIQNTMKPVYDNHKERLNFFQHRRILVNQTKLQNSKHDKKKLLFDLGNEMTGTNGSKNKRIIKKQEKNMEYFKNFYKREKKFQPSTQSFFFQSYPAELSYLSKNTSHNSSKKHPFRNIVNLRHHNKNISLNDKTFLHRTNLPSHSKTLDESSERIQKDRGACFTRVGSYFRYSDAETMNHIANYNIEFNLRIKTKSENGIILWAGSHNFLKSGGYLSLEIENGFLHFRYNLGSGEVDVSFNSTKISDGLWHRVRAIRLYQENFLEVDGRKSRVKSSLCMLCVLNTDTGLYVGGVPERSNHTKKVYMQGIKGCISEIVLSGKLKLNFNPRLSHTPKNIPTGVLSEP